MGLKTRTCAGAEMSIQTLKRAPAPPRLAWSILNVPLVPEREGEQAPQLPAQGPPCRRRVLENALDRAGVEEPLPAERLGRQGVAGERLQLPAKPRCGGNREAALAAAKERRRNERGHGLAQQHLLAQPLHLVLGREREREVRHEGVEERDSRLEGVRHRGPVGLCQQVVDEVDPEIDILQAGRSSAPSVSANASGAGRPGRRRCAAR